MKLNELQKGNLLTIQAEYSNGIHEFTSMVLGLSDDVVILSEAVVEGRRLRMPDKNVNVIFQVLNKLYIWKNVHIDTIPYKGHLFYRITGTGVNSNPYNRRGAFRLGVGEKFEMNIISHGELEQSEVYLKDMSESGICFTSETRYELRTLVNFIYMADTNYNIEAQVVREDYDADKHIYSYGCSLGEFNQDLGSFIIKEQMRRRRVSA